MRDPERRTPTKHRRHRSALGALGLLVAAWLAAEGRADAAIAEGFGAATPGGDGGAVVRVTTLADSGPGSLREALKGGHRTIVFDVAGEIALRTHLWVNGAYVTIDGFSAPEPGITLRNYGLVIRGSKGAHDVIVRGLRVRGSAIDGIQVSGGAYNVLIEHVSVDGSADGNIDITEDSRDVTVAWSILSGAGKNMLIKYGASRITLHHNIFIGSKSRNPQARIDDEGSVARELTLDMRNNLVWDFANYGTLVWHGAWANVAYNFYGPGKKAVEVANARAWVHGNRGLRGARHDAGGTEPGPFAAPGDGPRDACTSAVDALAGAGVRPLDEIDEHWLARVDLGECGVLPPVVPAPAPVPPAPVPPIASPGSGSAPGAAEPVPPAPRPEPTGPVRTIELRVTAGVDDARETTGSKVRLDTNQFQPGAGSVIAFRFTNVPIPRGAAIVSATLSTFALKDSRRHVALRYLGEASPDSAPFTRGAGSLTARATTFAHVDDEPGPWKAGQYHPSPDLAAIVEEIVAQPGWVPGASLTVFVADNGSRSRRRIAAFEHPEHRGRAAVLIISYRE